MFLWTKPKEIASIAMEVITTRFGPTISFTTTVWIATFSDLGLGGVTGDTNDNGKFRSPSLRNLRFTAPYMHDGRFATLDAVIQHYSEGLQPSATIDPLMKKVNQGGVGLSLQEKANLKAFLLSLSDPDFVNNPAFRE